MEASQPGLVKLQSTSPESLEILQAFAEFWKIPFTTREDASRVVSKVSYGNMEGMKGESVIIIPSGSENPERIARRYGLTVKCELAHLQLPVMRNATVSIRTQVYNFGGAQLDPIIRTGKNSLLWRVRDTDVYLLAIDLIGEYKRLMDGLEDRPHRRFLIISKLGGYTLIPQFIRNRAFKDRNGLDELREDTIVPMEFLRVAFLASIARTSRVPVPTIGFWRRGKDHVLAVTHDIETREGLEIGSRNLLDVEEKLGIHSTWNVPTHRYPIDRESIVKLARIGELGGHDTRHDGKLILVSPEKKIDRLSDCKETLEEKIGQKVTGFRSPLLQHNTQLIEALGKAGFTHDSSVPSWEPLSPTSLGPHGIGTIFPFSLSGILEIPVSLPQDHQLLRVIGLTPGQTVDALHKYSDIVQGLGGISVLLVHPDYELALSENRSEYERLLWRFARDPRCEILTLDGITKWWNFRSQTHWIFENERFHLDNPAGSINELQVKQVTGYDETMGFTMEELECS